MFKLNRTNQNDYQYDLYQEQLQQIKKNSLLYSNNPELVIKYFSINLDLSNNIDQVDVLFPQNVPISGDDDSNQQDYTASNTSAIHGTGMFDKFENFTYDIFEFTPIIEMSPFQYSPNSDNNEGTSGSMSIMTIDKPKVGDLFTYYAKRNKYGNNAVDQTEIFQITSIQMQRTSNDILPIYQLEFKTANILYENLKKFSINEIYFYDNLQNNFTSSKCWDEYQIISNNNDNFKLINKNYNKDKSYYEFNILNIDNNSPFIDKKLPLIFNNLIKRIYNSSYNQLRLKPVKNISTNLSIEEFLNLSEDNKFQELLLKNTILNKQTAPINIDLLTDDQIHNLTQDDKILINLKKLFTLEGNSTFLIKNVLYLYLFYYFLYKDCYNNILYSKLNNYIIPDDLEKFLNPLTEEKIFLEIINKYQTKNIIGFVDKDLRNNEFIIIDDLNYIMTLPKYIINEDDPTLSGYQEHKLPLNKVQLIIQNNFNIYLILFNYLNTIYKLAYCNKKYIKFPENLETERNRFKNSSKISNVKYYNIFNCIINSNVVSNDLLENNTSGNFYWNNKGIIIDYKNEIILPVGDLGLPIALSFQYGVQYRDIYNSDNI